MIRAVVLAAPLLLAACAAVPPEAAGPPPPGAALDSVAATGTEAAWAEGQAAYLAWNAERKGWTTTASGLQWRRVGPARLDGDQPGEADRVRVHYQGRFIDGREFDSSYARGEPAVFPVAGVVKGFGEGLRLLREGESADVLIPAELAYGAQWRGGGRIPPNSALLFRVELLEVLPAAE